jgi:S-DNA-T family DNA segregation ATPase FtsK/SpoIIIE
MGTLTVRRNPDPGGRPSMPQGEVRLPPPPELPEQASDGFTQALMYLPMGAMAIGMIAVVAGGHASAILYVGSGAMAVGMVGMMAGQMLRGRGDKKLKLNGLRRDYLRSLSQVRERARRAAAAQREVLGYYGPDPAILSSRVLAERMWDRTAADPDFLNVRIATGPQALAIRLVPPETKPLDDLDPLCAGALRRFMHSFASIPALPVSVRLRSFSRIVPEGDDEAVRGLVRALIAQVAVAHSPADVRISVCASAARIGYWEWVKWLPHNMHPTESDAAGPVRLLAPGLGQLAGMLAAELRDRPRFGSPAGPPTLPFHLVIADSVPPEASAELAGVDGVLVIDLAGSLPIGEQASLRLRVTPEQMYRGDVSVGVPDTLSAPEAEALARQLAPLRPAADGPVTDDALSATTTLTSLLGVADPLAVNVAALWRPRAPRDVLRVPLGCDAAGAPVELDIKESAQGGMGPHGLVIGATGSGKSELLRTLVLGLAMTHSPELLNFVLVDFKGGATFLGLDRLPHVSAVITNLEDELPLVDRMRDALAGELVRRQELFRQAGNYASLRDYTAARAAGTPLAPIPALFVVLDEFSELLAAKPDFIELFVTIGRVGRSLGVHLLLASQRLEEGRLRGLETQLSYRIGLRTFSAQESRIVLGAPDAYELPSAPGNGFLKVDTSGMTRFKAAYVSGQAAPRPDGDGPAGGRPRMQPVIAVFGPAYRDTELTVPRLSLRPQPAAPEKAESLLDVVVGQLAGRGLAAHEIWLPPLDAPPALAELLPPLAVTPRGLSTAGGEAQGMLRAVLGVIDRPFEQRRDPLWTDLSGAAGHMAVVGAPRSGKSTVLRTLVSSLALLHTPAEVQFYVLDFGGGTMSALSGLPHVGGVAPRSAADQVRRTVAELSTLLEQRERSFADRGIGTIAAYRQLGAAAGDGFGDVFLVVDGWLTLRQDYEDLEPTVTALAARGLGYGIHVVAAAGKWSEFRPAVRDLFGTRLELRLGDPYESEIGRAKAANVPADAPGRGLTRDGLHFLAAVPRLDPPGTAGPGAGPGGPGKPGRADSGPDSQEATRALAAAVDQSWTGPRARPIRMLPAVLPVASLPPATPGHVPFGLDERALATAGADFAADSHFLVFGDTECGKSNLLRVLTAGIVSAYREDQAKLMFIDYRRSLLDSAEVPHQIGYATSSVTATALLKEAREALLKRLPPPDLSPTQLRARDWWSGPDLFIIVDDYELVANAANPMTMLSELLPQARDIGLHVLLARSAGGAGRAMFEPVIQRMREMGSPGLVMSGSKDEGPLLGGVRPAAQPAGRGYLVERRAGSRLVQTALVE